MSGRREQADEFDAEAVEWDARRLWAERFRDMRGYPLQREYGPPSPFLSWAHEKAYRAALDDADRLRPVRLLLRDMSRDEAVPMHYQADCLQALTEVFDERDDGEDTS